MSEQSGFSGRPGRADESWSQRLLERLRRPAAGSAPRTGAAVTAGGRHWDSFFHQHGTRHDENRAEWQAHPVVQAYRDRQRGGRSIEEWFLQDCLGGAPVRHCLGIGAGVASFELGLVRGGYIERLDLVDASETGLLMAETRAREWGISDRVSCTHGDANTLPVRAGRYDVITFMSSLHHMSALETLMARCHDALESGGALFASEYVGPERFAFPDRDTTPARRLFDVIDPRLRRHGSFHVPDPAEVARVDPTEAVRSSEIEACLRDAFPDLRVFPRFGCLPYTLWWSLDHDALFETAQGVALVELVCQLDDALGRAGVLPSYFTDFFARKGA